MDVDHGQHHCQLSGRVFYKADRRVACLDLVISLSRDTF